ncbi:MAG: 4-(cytidine 5'-diphospho)-2-C-methyl-D-erythritol kinase [Bacteroidetes bacterium]|nr:MAG: 4-(cytidine 5'-diphospho)-2-C-methyl-D-erythritol kinase [Bacteroidota bacterium]
MIVFPNGKINIGLNIVGKRTDGFHDLESVFYPVPIRDALEVVPADQFRFSAYGHPIPGKKDENLCLLASKSVQKLYPDLDEIEIILYKNIPMGAGLGGGSSDGACTLKLLNQYYELNLTDMQLLELASELGSDCPFFIYNKPSWVRGRGEMISTIDLDLSSFSILLVYPDIHIDTAWAFSQITPKFPSVPIVELVKRPLAEWKSSVTNDFELPVFNKFPPLASIKNKLYEAGALYASMTGSGSTIYGIFEKNVIPSISFDQNFRVDVINELK